MTELPVTQPTGITAVRLDGVSKRFGAAVALDHVDLAAREGEFLTLLGPSGCGKTTCLRLISGLEAPDAGAVLLRERDVTATPPYRREVNQVFQSYALFPHLDVSENIAFGLRMKRLPAAEIRRRVASVVDLVALGELTRRRPSQLSGGQSQRVALARALVCEPKVLLLDEPLSALDARLRAEVRAELRALQKRLGLTFIFVTHDQEEALTLSDRIAVLRAGRVEQIGTAESVYHQPASRFVAGFVGEANLFEAEIVRRESSHCVCRISPGMPLLEVDAPDGRLPREPTGKITLFIRPESVRVRPGTTAMPDANTLNALVEDRVFQGATLSLVLRLESGSQPGAGPLVNALAVDPRNAPPLGARVQVTLPRADLFVLPG